MNYLAQKRQLGFFCKGRDLNTMQTGHFGANVKLTANRVAYILVLEYWTPEMCNRNATQVATHQLDISFCFHLQVAFPGHYRAKSKQSFWLFVCGDSQFRRSSQARVDTDGG